MFNNSNQYSRGDERREDKPPYSRVFVVCSKQTQVEDLRETFEQYGVIENLYMPRDRNTGESKGVAYIKYEKTSSAAAAIHDLHIKKTKINNKPIKVMVSASKNDNHSMTNEERYKRLFIKVHKDVTEKEIYDHFSEFGTVNSVFIQKDKVTDVCKGFAYVHFTNFLDAAKAFENCDKKYKPVFATPKDELKRSRNSSDDQHENSPYSSSPNLKDNYMGNSHMLRDNIQRSDNLSLLSNVIPQNYNSVIVTCTPQVSQKCIERLFNIVPGMEHCQYTEDSYNGFCKAVVKYNNEKSASHAVERINNFEFPSGELVSVKPNNNALHKVADNLKNIVSCFKNSLESGTPDLQQLAHAIGQASSIIKAATSGKIDPTPCVESQDNYCSVSLPPPQPMANPNSRVAQRCFIVCKPYPPSMVALRDAFSRFGDLIDVCTFPNKTFGFVKYASVRAAREAIKYLNGAVLCNMHLKVLEADERPPKEVDRTFNDQTDLEHGQEVKRIRLDNDSDKKFNEGD